MRLLFLCLLCAATSALAADPPTPFPLLGLWRVTAAFADNGRNPAPGEQMEMEFLPDGILMVTALSSATGTTPVRLQFRYSFLPPDVVTYTLDGDQVERQRFSVSDDTATFDHLDYKTHAKLRRILKTEFIDPPKEIHDFPKIPAKAN